MLTDIGGPVDDSTLMLEMIDSLSDKWAIQAAILQSTVSLPSFALARSRLVLGELVLEKRTLIAGTQVFTIHTNSGARGRGVLGLRPRPSALLWW